MESAADLIEKSLSAGTRLTLPFIYYGLSAANRAKIAKYHTFSYAVQCVTPDVPYPLSAARKLAIAVTDLSMVAAFAYTAVDIAKRSGNTAPLQSVAFTGALFPFLGLNALGLAEGLRYDVPNIRKYLKFAEAKLTRRIQEPLRKRLVHKLEACKQKL
jgi:hypothetical protein